MASFWCDWINSTSATTTAGMIWDSWNSTGTCAATTTGASVWPEWMRQFAANYSAPAPVPFIETAEQIAAREARIRKRKEEEAEAERRAEELLAKVLDDEQIRMYQQAKKFHVIGSDGERYEVEGTKRMHNVFRLGPDGRRVEELCIFATGGVPMGDHLAAQKLLLETDEKRFRQIANRWDLLDHRKFSAGRTG